MRVTSKSETQNNFIAGILKIVVRLCSKLLKCAEAMTSYLRPGPQIIPCFRLPDKLVP